MPRLIAIGRQGSDAVEVGEAADEGVALFAVSNYNIFDGNCHIVPEDLPEDAAVQCFVHGFAFDQHPGLGGVVKDEQVEAFGQLAQFHFPFHGDIRSGIVLYL